MGWVGGWGVRRCQVTNFGRHPFLTYLNRNMEERPGTPAPLEPVTLNEFNRWQINIKPFQEHCGEMWSLVPGMWNNINCDEKRGFVCQTYKGIPRIFVKHWNWKICDTLVWTNLSYTHVGRQRQRHIGSYWNTLWRLEINPPSISKHHNVFQ